MNVQIKAQGCDFFNTLYAEILFNKHTELRCMYCTVDHAKSLESEANITVM